MRKSKKGSCVGILRAVALEPVLVDLKFRLVAVGHVVHPEKFFILN